MSDEGSAPEEALPLKPPRIRLDQPLIRRFAPPSPARAEGFSQPLPLSAAAL